MFLSKFLIIVALNFLATNTALANNNLTPLESYIKKNPLWIQNFDDIAYISVRCSALYAILGGAFIELGRNDDDKKIGDAVLNRGRALMNIGVTSSADSSTRCNTV
jgi:hypothetical protein